MLENTGTFLLGIGPNNFHAASSLAGLFVSEERERGFLPSAYPNSSAPFYIATIF